MSLVSFTALCLLLGLGMILMARTGTVIFITHGRTTIGEDVPYDKTSKKSICVPDADATSSDDDDGSPNHVLVLLHKQVAMNDARRRLK